MAAIAYLGLQYDRQNMDKYKHAGKNENVYKLPKDYF